MERPDAVFPHRRLRLRPLARKHPKGGPWPDAGDPNEEDAAPREPCWLCGRPLGETTVWHHPVPKSRGGRDVVPMHPICQQTVIANFTNSELQRAGLDASVLLDNPAVKKFVDWVANKDPDFTATLTKKKR